MIPTKTKRDTCIKVAPDCKAKIALVNGNCVAARNYSSQLKEKLTESTVHSWVTKYKQEWSKKRVRGETDPEVTLIPSAK